MRLKDLSITMAALTVLAVSVGCTSLTPEEKRLALKNYQQRAQRARMERWEMDRSGSCRPVGGDMWQCTGDAP